MESIRRDAMSVDAVLARVGDEPALTELANVEVFADLWGSSAVQLMGVWLPLNAPVLLKVGVSASQIWWARELTKKAPHLVPTCYASGDRLGGAKLGWLVSERVQGGLHSGWGGAEFDMLMEAGVRFQRFAQEHPEGPSYELSKDQVAGWIETGVRRGAPGQAEQLLASLDADWEWLVDRCPPVVCHGDLHMANALSRTVPPDTSGAVLIDFEPCVMPWSLEAAYCQVLNTDPSRQGWEGLVGRMSHHRHEVGLTSVVGPEVEPLADLCLGWNSVRMWGLIGDTPDPGWRDKDVWRRATEKYVTKAIRLRA